MPAPKRNIMTSSEMGNRLIVKKLRLKASACWANIEKKANPIKVHTFFNLLNPSLRGISISNEIESLIVLKEE